MTTTAFDRVRQVVASDSRWSIPLPPYHVLYVDDTGCDKLADGQTLSMMFAGDGVLIEQWKAWFYNSLDLAEMPGVERLESGSTHEISICLVQKPTGKVIFDWGRCITHGDDARFSGSGAPYARDCYDQNRCAVTSIVSAHKSDPFTGGQTKFIELASGHDNLSVVQRTMQDAIKELNERGFVMDTRTKSVTPIKDITESANEVLRALNAGEKSLSAPTGSPSRPWTESEKRALFRAFESVVETEKAARARV